MDELGIYHLHFTYKAQRGSVTYLKSQSCKEVKLGLKLGSLDPRDDGKR